MQLAKPKAHGCGTDQAWDYLIVTASNEVQARTYEQQLALRRRRGELSNFGRTLVVADPGGQRIGSGGSTVLCLMRVLNGELAGQGSHPGNRAAWAQVFRRRRILIVHAGGDSRRLPAYGPCGKIFLPVPSQGGNRNGRALFDRLIPVFSALPAGQPDSGQVVVTAGDALILFDPTPVVFAQPGLTAVACPATPEAASKHGVFCAQAQGGVRRYLQKPKPADQRRYGAVCPDGRSLLDIGVMSFDHSMAMALLEAFEVSARRGGELAWPKALEREILTRGVDFFREICCALGSGATAAHHCRQARSSGSSWPKAGLKKLFSGLRRVPFQVQTVPECRFLHFGTTRQLITSGLELLERDGGRPPANALLDLNNQYLKGGKVVGTRSWVEGCRLAAPLKLEGENVVIGVDTTAPLALPQGACLDLLRGHARDGRQTWFVRFYGINDTFKDSVEKGATFCQQPLLDWLADAGVPPEAVWVATLTPAQRTLWNARLFPAVRRLTDYRRWLWGWRPAQATRRQKRSFLAADRYSAAEIAVLADPDAFFARRSFAKS